MPPKKANPRTQYFESIKKDKLDTLRWCLKNGGISTRAEDDDGKTGIQIAAAGGYSGALEMLLEFVKKVGSPDELEEVDDDGRTPLMMACHAGKLECARLLVLTGKVKLVTKCNAGKTARQYAEARKHEKIVAFLDNPKAPIPESSESEDDEEEEKKRVFKASQKAAGQVTAAQQQEEVHRQRVEAAEALEKALASAAPPVWPEIEPILNPPDRVPRRELSIRNKPALTGASGAIDPAVWNCVCLFDLRLEIAERKLTSLPGQLSRLTELVTLIVSGNALTALPDEISKLTKLKNLEAADNQLTELPAGLSELKKLQVVDVSSNSLTSLAPLSTLTELVAVNAGNNQLTELPLKWSELEHMRTLSAPKNAIKVFPPGIGSLQMLEKLDLAENAIEQVPIELGNLTVKKLMAAKLKGNPLVDARIRRFVEDDTPTLVKDLLNHVRKNGYKGEAPGGAGGGKKGGKGGKKGKGKGKAEKVESEDEEDNDASIAELLAAMGGGSDSSDDEDGKKPVKVS